MLRTTKWTKGKVSVLALQSVRCVGSGSSESFVMMSYESLLRLLSGTSRTSPASKGWGGITAAVSKGARLFVILLKDTCWIEALKTLGFGRSWGHTRACAGGGGGSRLLWVVTHAGIVLRLTGIRLVHRTSADARRTRCQRSCSKDAITHEKGRPHVRVALVRNPTPLA